MILGVDVVFIHTKNPIKLRKWYKEILDLDPGFATPDYHWQEFIFPEQTVSRFALDNAGDDSSEIEQQKIVISFKVVDIHGSVKKLESKGIEFYGSNKIRDVGQTLVATFQDIEGNWLQLSEKKNNEK